MNAGHASLHLSLHVGCLFVCWTPLLSWMDVQTALLIFMPFRNRLMCSTAGFEDVRKMFTSTYQQSFSFHLRRNQFALVEATTTGNNYILPTRTSSAIPSVKFDFVSTNLSSPSSSPTSHRLTCCSLRRRVHQLQQRLTPHSCNDTAWETALYRDASLPVLLTCN